MSTLTKQKTAMQELKDSVIISCGIKIDFRSHKYLDNGYGLTPCFSYEFAKKVVVAIYDYAFEQSGDRWIWNLETEIENLRSSSLKGLCLSILDDIERLNEE